MINGECHAPSHKPRPSGEPVWVVLIVSVVQCHTTDLSARLPADMCHLGNKASLTHEQMTCNQAITSCLHPSAMAVRCMVPMGRQHCERVLSRPCRVFLHGRLAQHCAHAWAGDRFPVPRQRRCLVWMIALLSLSDACLKGIVHR